MTGLIQTYFPDPEAAFWMILIGALTNVACAVLGCYLVLRQMSLLGDALSHAILPGLVLAFVLGGSLSIVWMLAGALVVGFLTTFLTQTLERTGRMPADAAMGVVFTSLFALGVVMLRRYAQGVHLDPDCVLYGQIEYAEVFRMSVWGWSLPRALVVITPVFCLNLVVILIFWKELKLATFDTELAASLGFNVTVLHYLLMGLVALTAVASFEQVGSILVIAMLIAPAATAHLLTDRLSTMMLLAAGLGVAAAVVGYLVSVRYEMAAAGPMAVAVGLFYVAAMLLSPRYGVVSTLVRNLRTSLRVVREDVLGMLFRLEEQPKSRRLSPAEIVRALGAGWRGRAALWSLASRGEIVRGANEVHLSDRGRVLARQMVRTHRLWESFLVERVGLSSDHVHDPAEREEHFIDARLAEQIQAELPDPATDPHGKSIPE